MTSLQTPADNKGSVTRIHKPNLKGNFTQVSNDLIWDKSLSLEARMVLIAVQSLPDGFHMNREQLAARLGIGTRKMQTVYRELETAGYRHKTRKRCPGGKYKWEFDWYAAPHHAPATGTDTTGADRTSGTDQAKHDKPAGQTTGAVCTSGDRTNIETRVVETPNTLSQPLYEQLHAIDPELTRESYEDIIDRLSADPTVRRPYGYLRHLAANEAPEAVRQLIYDYTDGYQRSQW